MTWVRGCETMRNSLILNHSEAASSQTPSAAGLVSDVLIVAQALGSLVPRQQEAVMM